MSILHGSHFTVSVVVQEGACFVLSWIMSMSIFRQQYNVLQSVLASG
jgi:hypothetical protein